MPTVMVPGVMVMEEAMVLISRSVSQCSGSATMAGDMRSPGVTTSTPIRSAPRITSDASQPP
ncbi:hypothetical protein BJF80_02205 [Serinicoccus sp. CUA-874]|nr:hypothetical protein BJF80_02205 [Serinicoccus sp. CUA-874]